MRMNLPKLQVYCAFLFLMAFLIIFSQFSIAHLDVGEDKVIDDYLIDFGYSPENPSTKETTFMSLNILNNETRETINITSVWIRISNSKGIVFSGEFKSENGNAFLNYKFPYGDIYEITVRFKNNENTIVETDFDIKVEEKSLEFNLLYYIMGFIVLVVIGFIIISIIGKKKKFKWKK